MKFSNKLSLAILITGMVVLILLSFAIYKISYNTIIKSQSMYSRTIADEVSDDIDYLLYEKVKTALTLANTPIIKKALETSNSSYSDLPDEKRKKSIKLLNEKWKSTKDPADSFVLKFTDNKVSQFLKTQQALLEGEYGEIFLTNKFGALVASTSKLSTLAHGHKYWWLGSYGNGEGAVFFDDRGYDDSVGGYVLGLVVPIRKGTEIFGILKCNLNILGSISELISGAENKSVGKFKLTRSGGMVVFEEGFEPLSTQIHDSIFRRLENKDSESFIIDDSGEKYLVGFSEIKLTKGEKGYGFGGTFESIDHKKGNTGESWYVIFYRQMSGVLAPITESIKSIILIGSAIIVILVLVSYLIGRKIAQPLATFDKATEEIGKGDFEYRIDVARNDEFGNLARAFNNMANKLQRTTTSVDLLENEIKHRKETEKSFRESEALLQAAMDQSQAGIAIADAPDGKLRYVNNSGLGIRGKTKEENVDGIGIGQYVASWQILHLDGTPCKEDEVPLARAVMYGEVCSQEFIVRRPDEEDRIVLANAAPIFNDKGEVFAGVVVFLDVTDRKYAEEALRNEKKLIDMAFDSLPGIFYLFTKEGKFLRWNQNFEKVSGYTAAEISRMRPRDFFPVEEQAIVEERIGEVFADGDSFVEANWLSKNGTKTLFYLTGVRVNIEGTPCQFGMGIDISDRKRAEEEREKLQAQLQHAQKMEAIGTLAGGVAHDLNNILGGLVSYPELLLLKLPEDSPLRKSILTIQKSGEKAAAVVQDLLTLARRGVVVTEVVNLSEVIVEYLKSPELENLKLYHPGVHIETRLEKDVLNILGSSTHLSKTVMNLVSNAAEAMPEGGKLTVTTENRYLDRPIKGYDDVREGDYVVLTISDTGTGIASDDLNKIFEPFYTKKKMGRSGTGLGMAVVWGTVKDHNGYIHVQSTEGRGTTFTLYFPITREELPEADSHLAIESYSGNGESILIVDDVEEQRKIASGMLEELGYSVVSVSSGEKAVEYLKTNKVDLLVLDMIMDPGMDGLDTYKKILEIHPEQKAIIGSGFSETDRVKELQSLGAGAYVRKPFLLEKIGLAVREELEK